MEWSIILLAIAVIGIVIMIFVLHDIENKKKEYAYSLLYFVPDDFFEDHEYDCEFELAGHLYAGDKLTIYSPVQEMQCEVMSAKYDEEADATVVIVAVLLEREA
ncbi:MAG: hypothetical protein IJ309_02395 [Clostridia bacterium]|nr:hypothetical protein [Clostridia bacterium]